MSRIKSLHRAIASTVVDVAFALVFLAVLAYAGVAGANGREVHPAFVIAAGMLGLSTGAAITWHRVAYVQARAIRDAEDTSP